jgi:hypothetical protein
MTEMVAVAKLLAREAGTATRITRERWFPISSRPLVLVPIVMAGESPSLFGVGVGDGTGPVRIFTCANPVNRDEQYPMLAAALAAMEPTVLWWEMSSEEVPQLVVTGADSARLSLGLIDRSLYSQRPQLVAVARRLAWFDKRSDCPDSASVLVLPRALSACFATGQDEHGDLHLGAFLEWCAPADGRVWERVGAAEQLPASGSTSPEFDRDHLAPAADQYYAAVKNGDAPAARRAKKTIQRLIGSEVERRYALAKTALRLLRGVPEGRVALEIAAEDRESFIQHVEYVADPSHHLRRSLSPEMQTSEFMSREFAADRITALSLRSVSGAYANARLAGDLLEGKVVGGDVRKIGRRTLVAQTIASSQQLSLRAGDKLELLADDRFVYRIRGLAPDPKTGNTLVSTELVNGMRLPGLPAVGGAVVLVPPARERAALARVRVIAWERMRALPVPAPAPAAVRVTEDLASAVAALRGKQ